MLDGEMSYRGWILSTQYYYSLLTTQYSGLRDEMLDMSDSDSLLEMGTGKSSDASWRWFATLGRLNDWSTSSSQLRNLVTVRHSGMAQARPRPDPTPDPSPQAQATVTNLKCCEGYERDGRSRGAPTGEKEG